MSAGAVALGAVSTWNITNTTQWDMNFNVEDCEIANMTMEYSGCAAVFAGYVDSTTIAHNHIINTSYSGISIGWGWGHEAGRRGNNHIIGNRIEGVLHGGLVGQKKKINLLAQNMLEDTDGVLRNPISSEHHISVLEHILGQ